MELQDLHDDLAAFADDDQDLIIERSGDVLLVRGGKEISFRVVSDGVSNWFVHLNGDVIPYRRFLSHNVAGLDVLAERLATRRTPVAGFIDGPAYLTTVSNDPRAGRALDLLRTQCDTGPAFAAQVVFLTADAGFGKTAVLREFQARQARQFVEGTASFVLWHVDLQGRQLLRLSEALMGDLGDLRVSGLWMPGIVRLLRHRLLVLAVDGFDELAAEQGSTDALGALALLVQELRDSGTIVAASRRTFFDTDDYVVRAGVLHRSGAFDCEFDELRLSPWTREEVVAYMGRAEFEDHSFADPGATYDAIVAELGENTHPMATRPFLISQMIRALLLYDLSPSEFLRGVGDDPLKGVGTVVRAFVNREVASKWRQQDTGEPFLTADQHMRLLGDVAEEMFRSQTDRLDLDVVEAITSLLLEEWKTDPARRQQVIEMVKMHVLLTVPPDGNYRMRGFDHPEFRDYFAAQALAVHLARLDSDADRLGLGALLSAAPLTDATARYAAGLVDRTDLRIRTIISGLATLVGEEWRPTHLQSNVGTMIPYLLDQVAFSDRIDVDARVIYSSLVFENTTLTNVTIRNGTFANTSFVGVDWRGVVLNSCDLGDLSVDSTVGDGETAFLDCKIDSVRLLKEGEEEQREFAPDRMTRLLGDLGIAMSVDAEPVTEPAVADGEARRMVQRLLRVFRRTTSLSDATVDRRFRADASRVLNELIPLMVEYGIVREKPWRGSGHGRIWVLTATLEEILRADGSQKGKFSEFWRAVDKLDGS